MSNILLIGASGFIGRNLADFLSATGHQVVLHTRTGLVQAGYPAVHCALDDIGMLRREILEREIDSVLHLASGLIPSSGRKDFDVEMQTLIRPTFDLIEVLAELGKRFVYFSSGGALYAVPDDAPLAEDGALEPISYYGYSKLMVEQYVRMATKTKGLRYLIFRPSNPYGRHQRSDGKQGFIAVVLARLLQSSAVEVWGDGSVVRDYVLIDDLCSAVECVMNSGIENETFNVGSGKGHSINDVMRLAEAVSGRKLEVLYRPGRSVDRPRIVLDQRRIRSVHNALPLELERGLALVWQELVNA